MMKKCFNNFFILIFHTLVTDFTVPRKTVRTFKKLILRTPSHTFILFFTRKYFPGCSNFLLNFASLFIFDNNTPINFSFFFHIIFHVDASEWLCCNYIFYLPAFHHCCKERLTVVNILLTCCK